MSSNVRADRRDLVLSNHRAAARAPAAPTLRQRLLGKLQAWAHAFAWRDAWRDDFLAESVDLKDYERRLRALDDAEQCRARYLDGTMWP
jgi:hypothetical protein